MSRTFMIPSEVSEERINDFLCNMWETAPSIVEWAKCVRLQRPKQKVTYRWEYPMKGGALFFKDIGDDEGETYKLDEEAVLRGLAVMAQKYPRHFSDFRNENDDALTADVFLQCALFGEVKYC